MRRAERGRTNLKEQVCVHERQHHRLCLDLCKARFLSIRVKASLLRCRLPLVIFDARRQLSVLRTKVLGIQPVSELPYATHLPILVALARLYSVRSVLELGAGPHSTSLFLDRVAFPDMKSVTSFEDDPEWKDVVLDAVGDDDRLDLRLVDAVRYSVPSSLDGYNLVFIDDSRTLEERTVTVNTVRENKPTGLVVIHDFENRHYRAAARGYDHRYVFKAFTPQVGVCWFGDAIQMADLERAQRLVLSGRGLPLTDVHAWDQHLADLTR